MLTYAKEHQQTLPVPIKLSLAGATPSFWHKLERQDYFAQLFWDIKISKPLNVTFLKMVELCHFLSFSDLSERNYNSQSFWITLYQQHQRIRASVHDMKSQMIWNLKWHEMSKVTKTQNSWNVKCHEMSNVMKCHSSRNLKCHEMSKVMKHQMS